MIEVNVHPAASWQELVDNISALYEEAFYSRLGTDKFMVDGRHTGHRRRQSRDHWRCQTCRQPGTSSSRFVGRLITSGNHTGVELLVLQAFIGPTSQAPRIDEGRDDRLYEVEIAFDQIPDNEEVPFWMVDRISGIYWSIFREIHTAPSFV